jgi:hypothetical protein
MPERVPEAPVQLTVHSIVFLSVRKTLDRIASLTRCLCAETSHFFAICFTQTVALQQKISTLWNMRAFLYAPFVSSTL